MTVSASSTRELDITRLCLRAYQTAGLITPYQELDDAQAAMARDFIEHIVDELQNEGMMLREATFPVIQLVPGTTVYTFPATVLRVFGDGMYAAEGETDPPSVELRVKNITLAEWHTLGAKASESIPLRYAVDYSAGTVQVRYWPVPTDAGTVRHMAQRLLADNNDGTKNIDLERGATGFILYELAACLAEAHSLPLKRCQYLRGIAMDKREKMKTGGREQASFTVEIDHRGGW